MVGRPALTCVEVVLKLDVCVVDTAVNSIDAGEENGDDSSEGQANRLPLLGL